METCGKLLGVTRSFTIPTPKLDLLPSSGTRKQHPPRHINGECPSEIRELRRLAPPPNSSSRFGESPVSLMSPLSFP
ncbi:hypothetical protein SESBI_11664 [Sesbania bispinosa]|nr:hypothetical protein SESBI_11664 [Sesbania bispinosa]